MPIKIPAHKLGTWIHPKYGPLTMNQQKMDEMKRNFADGAIGRKVFIRIGHDTANSSTFGGAAAEAIVQQLVQEGEVLWALCEPTTPEAAELVKKYRYSSPEYKENYTSKLDGSMKGCALEAIALTNEPFLPGLPECIALSDSPDGFYLNFKEANSMEKMDELISKQDETNGLLRKLADNIVAFFKKPDDKPDPAPTPAAQPPADTTTKLLADMQAQIDAATASANTAREAQRISEIERKLSDYTNAGIPPVYIDQARKILLGEVKDGKQEGGVIKLADDGFNKSISDVYAMLDAFPPAARVPLNKQIGAQGAPPVDQVDVKLADESMEMLGYKKNEQGKYVL